MSPIRPDFNWKSFHVNRRKFIDKPYTIWFSARITTISSRYLSDLFDDLHGCNSNYTGVKMTNIRTTLPDVIRSDRPFSATVIHVFSPIYTHVLSWDALGVKSPVKFFKIEPNSERIPRSLLRGASKKYRMLEDIAWSIYKTLNIKGPDTSGR